MRYLRALWIRFRGLFAPSGADADISAELESHLQMHIDDNLRAGMPEPEARRHALIQLGGVEQTRQAVRERNTLPSIETLGQDLRFALRQLRKSPGFAAVVIITLALGIGVNTALFSIVDTVLLHPIALPHPGELVSVDAAKPNFEHGSISYPNFRDWQQLNRSFSGLGVYRHMGFVMTGRGESERVRGNLVSSSFLPLLGVKPILGRLFAPGEDEIGRSPLIILGGGFWARKFGSDPRILGQSITLDGSSYTVIGIVPASFNLTFGAFIAEDVYLPIGQWPTQALKLRGAGLGIHGVARLKPGVSLAQAREDMDAVSAHLAATYPEDDHDVRANVTPLRDVVVGDVQSILFVLLAAVAFVLLIACANVANLLLARSTVRAQEFGVRLALGASRRRIVRQVLTESTLLALAGGALGFGLAALGVRAAVRLAPNALAPNALPRLSQIHLSPLILGLTFVISLAVGILFGLVPALAIASHAPQSALREGNRTVRGTRHRTQDSLVIFEVAAAVILLAGAGLMIRSLAGLAHTDPGFDSKGVLWFSVATPNSPAIDNPVGARAYLRQVDRQILNVPGVSSVSLIGGGVPLTGDDDEELFWLQNEPKPADQNDMHWALLYIVEPEYLKVMHLSLVRGRFFTDADREDSPHVVVIDEDLAHQFFGSADPIGQVVNLTNPSDTQATVVGVVRHILHWGLDGEAGSPLRAQIYLPLGQLDGWQLVSTTGIFSDVLVRSDRPATVFPDIQRALRRLNGTQVAWRPKTMDQVVADTLAARRFSMMLLAAFAALALLLASVGLYGVISYLVSQRTQEMAIRMALGADRGDVMRWVLRRGAALAGAGVFIGTIGALIVTRLMASVSIAHSSIIYGVRPWDPLTMMAVVVVLMSVALLACYVPARRAASVDPMQALRAE